MKKSLIYNVLKKHLPEIVEWIYEEIDKIAMAEDVRFQSVDELVESLPCDIQTELINKEAFFNAYEKGFLVYEHGRWISKFESIRQLTYFCGRCFCGDTVVGRKLFKGEKDLPTSILERLFDVDDMHDPRKKLQKHGVPKRYKVLDTLFDMC